MAYLEPNNGKPSLLDVVEWAIFHHRSVVYLVLIDNYNYSLHALLWDRDDVNISSLLHLSLGCKI